MNKLFFIQNKSFASQGGASGPQYIRFTLDNYYTPDSLEDQIRVNINITCNDDWWMTYSIDIENGVSPIIELQELYDAFIDQDVNFIIDYPAGGNWDDVGSCYLWGSVTVNGYTYTGSIDLPSDEDTIEFLLGR